MEAVEPPYVSELTGVAEKSVELYVPLCKFDQPGEHRQIGVKVIDDRGNELMVVEKV